MPFHLVKHPELELAFALGSGIVTHEEMIEAIDQAYCTGAMVPGIDRVTVMHPSADLQALDLERIQKVQKVVVKWEAASNRVVNFRSIFVYGSLQHRVVGALLKASWQALGEAGAQIHFASTVNEAIARLGKRNGELLRAAALAAQSLPNQGDWLR